MADKTGAGSGQGLIDEKVAKSLTGFMKTSDILRALDLEWAYAVFIQKMGVELVQVFTISGEQ